MKWYEKYGRKGDEMWNDMENMAENTEKIRKIQKKLWNYMENMEENSEKICNIWKKDKLNSEIIWKNREENWGE